MREIKFNFIYGIDGETETYFNKTFTFGEIEGGCHFDEISDSPLMREYSILGKRQWTGLYDKSGEEIYSGDLLKVPDDYDTYGFMADEVREIYFKDGAFRFKPKSGIVGRGHILEDDREFEVIGNIHTELTRDKA